MINAECRADTTDILVVGAGSMLGRHLAARLEAAGTSVWRTSREVRSGECRHAALNLADDADRWQLPSSPLSAAVVCAAVTSQVHCREEPRQTARVNVHGTIALLRALATRGVFTVFPSSNTVFDGTQPHRRQDEPVCPRTEYGRQKALVEQELRTFGQAAAVVRFTKILSPETPLIRGWINALRAGREIHPFSDMVMAPVTHEFAVEVLKRIAESHLSGLFQVSGLQDVSYAEVARYLAHRLGASPALVTPVPAAGSGIVAEAVPAHTTLDVTRLRRVLGMEPAEVWHVIDTTFDLV